MTREEKFLLLQDLCARLPYNCRVFYEYVDDLDGKTYGYSLTLNTWCIDEFVANKAVIKPYLRPMSSMTEEEREDFWFNVLDIDWRENLDIYDEEMETAPFPFVENGYGFYLDNYYISDTFAVIDWLNKHHFDFRNLIERGLAIKVTEENNPYKE